MTLYYTTSAGENEDQQLPQISLGGYKSSTIVKNDEYDNLFGEISFLTLQQDRPHYIALMAVNETGVPLTNCQIWVEYPESPICKLEIAVVDPALDNEGKLKMERTREMFNKPFVGNFQEYTSDNKGLIGSVSVDEYIGLWIKRTVVKESVLAAEDSFYEPDPTRRSMYREVETPTVENVNIKISWD